MAIAFDPQAVSLAGPEVAGERIRVRGLVQGVGFRPHVWRLARKLGLTGAVGNDAEGVWIEAFGAAGARDALVQDLQHEAPPLARVDAIERTPWRTGPSTGSAQAAAATDFRIAESHAGAVHTGVVPDAATCKACRAEVLAETPDGAPNRRAGYAFTNCTHCGPRLSIVRGIPYDRANTSMAAFALCPACRREYDDPANRRFHAQPNACPECGPQLWIEATATAEPGSPEATRLDIGTDDDPIALCRRLLASGQIVAIKGLGGIHLAVDAGNRDAVRQLRLRKQRPDKPLALMARDVATVRRYARLSDAEAAALETAAAPIVLLQALPDGETLAPEVAPGQRTLGFMLPYTPLHHLLMQKLERPIVLTSGNRSEEPQCIDNACARERLGSIADALLLHDRDIVNRLDDSVVRCIAGRPVPLRRARGFAPAPLTLPEGFASAPEVLALGGELKNTFCLLRDGQAILSQHLGDLENARANGAWREALERYHAIFAFTPQALAIDAHPEYLPSKHGRQQSATKGLPLIEVQHHHAHIAACMAEHGLPVDTPPVYGIALDGLGWGDDGSLWGTEILSADYRGYRRLAHLAPVAMPGGVQAIRQPWRMAFAHLLRLDDYDRLERELAALAWFRALQHRPVDTLAAMIRTGFNSPLTSSCGRLFDAAAALMGLCDEITFEGQAAIALEAAVDPDALAQLPPYPFDITGSQTLVLDPAPLWRALLADLARGERTGVMAARFHSGLAEAVRRLLGQLRSRQHRPGRATAPRVALSGGVFQNAVFSGLLIEGLQADGLEVLRHERVPPNDGGLSLGQAVVAAARLSNGPATDTGGDHAQ